MLYNITMPRGRSGRIVLEIPAADKALLYEALDEDNLTLKHWFVERVYHYLRERSARDQPWLLPDLEDPRIGKRSGGKSV